MIAALFLDNGELVAGKTVEITLLLELVQHN